MCFPDFQIDNLDSGLVLREIFFNFLDCLKCTDFEILSFYFFFWPVFQKGEERLHFSSQGFLSTDLLLFLRKEKLILHSFSISFLRWLLRTLLYASQVGRAVVSFLLPHLSVIGYFGHF